MPGRVVIDPGNAGPQQYGIAIYNSNLLSTIADIAPLDLEIEQLALADPGELIPGWRVPASGLKARRMPVMRMLARLARGFMVEPVDRALVGRSGIYHALVAAEALPVERNRRIVSIHDASIFHPEIADEFTDSERNVVRTVVEESAGVVTVSEFSRSEVLKFTDVDSRDIAIVPGAVDHTRFFPRSAEDIAAVRDRYGLERRYAISVAGTAPRKRLGEVEAIADRLWRKERIELLMVGAGRGLRPGARRLGFVPREHLPALYSGAVSLISMSEYEGFGLAPLESLACGTPVVAARAEAVVEVLGDAATFVDVGDVDGAAKSVLKLVDGRARRKVVEKGIAHASRFRWNETAGTMLDVYRAILAGGRVADIPPAQDGPVPESSEPGSAEG